MVGQTCTFKSHRFNLQSTLKIVKSLSYISQIKTLMTNSKKKKTQTRTWKFNYITIDASRDRCGADDVAISSFFLPLSLSLSLLFSKAGSHLKWKWKWKWFSVVLALKFGQLEMLFSLTEFEVTTKHPHFSEIISGISLKSIQMQP